MRSKTLWVVAGLVVLAALAVGVTQLSAQFGPGMPGMPGFGPAPVGRYVVARQSGDSIVILDTTSGELYLATSADIKKFSEKPRPAPPRPPFGKDKDKDDDEKDKDKEKRRPKKEDD